jgi:hypothetical protein
VTNYWTKTISALFRFSCFDSTLEKCHSRKRQIFLIFFEPLSLKRRLLGRFNAMFPFIQSRLCSFSFFLWLVGRKQLRTRTGEGVKERGGVGLKKIRNSTSTSPPHTNRTHHPHSRVPFSFSFAMRVSAPPLTSLSHVPHVARLHFSCFPASMINAKPPVTAHCFALLFGGLGAACFVGGGEGHPVRGVRWAACFKTDFKDPC